MPLIETLTTLVGGAVVKHVATIWFGDSAFAQETGGKLADLVETRAATFAEKRRLKRQFEQIADVVGERLERHFEIEYRGIDENEQEAAAIAVATTLDRVPIGTELMLGADLDPARLKAHMLRHDPDRAEQERLGEAATELYGLCLEEACQYIVDIARTLQSFPPDALTEVLRRETEIIALINEVLSRLPVAAGPGADEAAAFESRYRRQISTTLDNVELFGLSTSRIKPSYALSAAYISLAATVGTDGADDGRVRVEEALRGSNRFFIRGEAGSGKTTLLQWLAVRCARGELLGLSDDWSDKVPFMVRLRQYGGADLPDPNAFLEHTARALRSTLHDPRWVADVLDSGRGLVLVDGVDELPEDRRTEVRDWLADLCRTFDRSAYVVTSRPAAVGEDWLSEQGFVVTALQPMDTPDVFAFIDHWHAAAELQLSRDECAELADLQRQLKLQVQYRPPIQDLARSPLLCAMLCILNWDRRGELPEDRKQLYDIAIETLIQRRDAERRGLTDDGVKLGFVEKRLLLQDLAYWLLLSDLSDVEKPRAISRTAGKLKELPRVNAEPGRVFQHLLVRSGLLREPVEGRIDFVHRTFQEYLAAGQAVEKDEIEVLLNHAHLDQWREVIVLAAGHAQPAQRERLVQGLIDLGDANEAQHDRLHLMALGCVEVGRELSPELQEKVDRRVRSLVPPEDVDDAAALAAAGESVVPLLAGYADYQPDVAAACVRSLGLIGGESALRVLRTYGPSRHRQVVNELVRAWDAFPASEYAQLVLAESPLYDGVLQISASEYLPALVHLEHLRSLVCNCFVGPPATWADVRSVAQLPALTSLRYVNASELTDLGPLSALAALTLLEISGAGRLYDLEPLAPLGGLRAAGFRNCHEIDDLRPLGRLRSLEELAVGSASLQDLRPLAELDTLRRLDLTGCRRIASVEPLLDLPLTQLRLGTFVPLFLEGVATAIVWPDLPGERTGSIEGDPKASGLESLGGRPGFASLAVLTVSGGSELADLSALAGARRLRMLGIHAAAVTDLTFLGEHPELHSVSLTGNFTLESLRGIERAGAVEELTVERCPVAELSPLAGLQHLRRLKLRHCTDLTDLQPLADLPALEHLDLSGSRPDLDLSPVADRPGLDIIEPSAGFFDAIAAAFRRETSRKPEPWLLEDPNRLGGLDSPYWLPSGKELAHYLTSPGHVLRR